MLRRLWRGKIGGSFGAALLLALCSCAAGPLATTGESAWKAREDKLLLERNSTNNTIVRLEGELLPDGTAAGQGLEETARAVLRTYHTELLIRDPDSEFVLARSKRDQLGYTHIRFTQQYQGVPVWKAALDIHFDAQQRPYLLSGAYYPTPEEVDTNGGMGENAALQNMARIDPGAAARNYSVRKVIFFRDGRHPRLAYELKPQGMAVLGGTVYIMDAATGEVLNRLPVIRTSRKHP
ncbi:MAG TPA: hypothetical protein ENJ43_05760 [Gammaproteobacteria bacterium]|nr:hypothetical protein [Gammaproteobacteria bacterium]